VLDGSYAPPVQASVSGLATIHPIYLHEEYDCFFNIYKRPLNNVHFVVANDRT
jgi:hypothetical protein